MIPKNLILIKNVIILIYNYFPLMLKFCEFKLLNSISIFFLPHAPLLEARWIDSRVAIQFFHLQAFDCVTRGLLNIYRNLSRNRKGKCFHRIKRDKSFVLVVSFRLFSRRNPLFHIGQVFPFDSIGQRWDCKFFTGGLFRGTTRIVTRLKPRKNLLFKGKINAVSMDPDPRREARE